MSEEKEKNPFAVGLGKLSAAKRDPEELAAMRSLGGKARAASLTPERRKEIAQKASKAAAKARTAKAKAARNAKRAAKKAENEEKDKNVIHK